MKEVYEKLKYPSICMLIIGMLNIMVGFLGMLTLLDLYKNLKVEHFENPAERSGYILGAAFFPFCSFLSIIFSPIIIYGSIQMMSAKNYKIAKLASILVLVPFTSICCLLGIPVGIWSLAILNKPEIKSNFG